MTPLATDGCRAPAPVVLLESGDAGWIAGVVYLENILRALDHLTAQERPPTLVLGLAYRRSHLSDIPAWAARRQIAYLDGLDPAKRLLALAMALLRGPTLRSATTVAHAAGARVLFPVPAYFTSTRGLTGVGWVPDFQFLHLPQFWPDPFGRKQREWIRRTLDNLPHVVVSSETALADLHAWHPRAPDSVSVLRFASVLPPAWLTADPAPVRERYGLPERFLMFPSQFWQHKDHATLFSAVANLARAGHRNICLVCTGAMTDFRRPGYVDGVLAGLRASGAEARVRLLGLLPRFDQVQLMRAAAAIVQPSLFEGWSALLEDCRALGKTVYATDLPIHREQAVPGVIWFQPGDVDGLANLLGADWPRLAPGPDWAAEAAAQPEMQPRIHAFAKAFLAIMQRAVAA